MTNSERHIITQRPNHPDPTQTAWGFPRSLIALVGVDLTKIIWSLVLLFVFMVGEKSFGLVFFSSPAILLLPFSEDLVSEKHQSENACGDKHCKFVPKGVVMV